MNRLQLGVFKNWSTRLWIGRISILEILFNKYLKQPIAFRNTLCYADYIFFLKRMEKGKIVKILLFPTLYKESEREIAREREREREGVFISGRKQALKCHLVSLTGEAPLNVSLLTDYSRKRERKKKDILANQRVWPFGFRQNKWLLCLLTSEQPNISIVSSDKWRDRDGVCFSLSAPHCTPSTSILSKIFSIEENYAL